VPEPRAKTRDAKSRASETPNQPASTAGMSRKPVKDERLYVARIALAALRLPATAPISPLPEMLHRYGIEVETSIRAALSNDSRVTKVIPAGGKIQLDNVRALRFFDQEPSADDLFGPKSVGYTGLRLQQSIYFEVHVPAKNQPRYRDSRDIPSDDYLVSWNGAMLAVQWEQDSQRASISGGHVVIEILESAVRSAGFDLTVIGCEKSCGHRFLHMDVVTFETGPVGPHFASTQSKSISPGVATPFTRKSSPSKNLQELEHAIYPLFERYFEAKTLADRVIDLATRAQFDCTSLASLLYEISNRRHLPHPGALLDLVRVQGSRRYTRKLIARMWLAVAQVEILQARWHRHEQSFEEAIRESNAEALSHGLDTKAGPMSKVDMTVVRATLQDIGSRTDSRNLLVATLVGALAGAGAGLISALVNLSWSSG
jgi:hypothetical protein